VNAVRTISGSMYLALKVIRYAKVRSLHTEMMTGKTLRQIVRENVSKNAHLMTDDGQRYSGIGKHFRRHSTIRHS